MKVIIIILAIISILAIRYLFFKKSDLKKREYEYLQKMNKSSSDFGSEEEKLVYLAEHLEEIDDYYSLASDLSKIKNKPHALKNAINIKIIQCFIHYKEIPHTPFGGILSGIFEHSADPELEYGSFLESVIEEESPLIKKEYLDSISLFQEQNSSSIFSIQEKVKILACKYLLRINPQHKKSIDYLLQFDSKRTISDYNHYFIVRENDWSGQGILNEHGEWILPPLFILNDHHKVFNEGFANFELIYNIYKNSKANKSKHTYSSYGNWIKPNGELLFDFLVPNPNPFSGGVARCYNDDNPKYIDSEGNFIASLEGAKIRYFENGYSATLTENNVIIKNSSGVVIANLDKQYTNVHYLPSDHLISYGYTSDWPGEGKYGYLDLDGNQLTEAIFYTSSDYSYKPASFLGKDLLVIAQGANSYGLINRKFETLIPFEYQHLKLINDKYVIARNDDEYYLFDTKGKLISNKVPKLFKADYFRYENEIGLTSLNDVNYIIDIEGKEISGFKNYSIKDFEYGKISLKNKEGKFGVMDVNCQQVLPFIYDYILILSKDLVLAQTGNKYVSINLSTTDVFEFPADCQLKEYILNYNPNYIRFEKNSKSGIVSPTGKIIIPFNCFDVYYGGTI